MYQCGKDNQFVELEDKLEQRFQKIEKEVNDKVSYGDIDVVIQKIHGLENLVEEKDQMLQRRVENEMKRIEQRVQRMVTVSQGQGSSEGPTTQHKALEKEMSEVREKVKNELEERKGLERRLKSLEENKATVSSANAEGYSTGVKNPNQDEMIAKATNEIQGRFERKNNVIIFNIKELDSDIHSEVVRNDITLIKEIGAEVGEVFDDSDILKTIRIGQKGKTKVEHNMTIELNRPILVTLKEDAKERLMKNIYKLRKSQNEKLKIVSVKHDMSREERENDRKLRDEAKQLNLTDSKNWYVVRGFPWERKIITLKNAKKNLNQKTTDQVI